MLVNYLLKSIIDVLYFKSLLRYYRRSIIVTDKQTGLICLIFNLMDYREGGRHEANSAQSTQDRRKLLKRTRSLAVISEDESRHDRETHHFRLGQSTFDLPRRHQLIPRAKLIDRNSLKDRYVRTNVVSETAMRSFRNIR